MVSQSRRSRGDIVETGFWLKWLWEERCADRWTDSWQADTLAAEMIDKRMNEAQGKNVESFIIIFEVL